MSPWLCVALGYHIFQSRMATSTVEWLKHLVSLLPEGKPLLCCVETAQRLALSLTSSVLKRFMEFPVN